MVKEFIKESFRNGNRYTNIVITIIMFLLAIIGFFGRELYGDFKEMKFLIYQHETKIQVLQSNVNHLETKNLKQ